MNLSIKNVPDALVNHLRRRAKKNHRSLQGELMALIEQTVSPEKLSVEEARSKICALRYQTGSDGERMVREDRDGR